MPDTPFDEDRYVIDEANKRGLTVFRRSVIELNQDLLPSTYKRSAPDYIKIRRHLLEGIPVPGAKLTTRVEYILSPADVVELSEEPR